jgi:hypothetical protein
MGWSGEASQLGPRRVMHRAMHCRPCAMGLGGMCHGIVVCALGMCIGTCLFVGSSSSVCTLVVPQASSAYISSSNGMLAALVGHEQHLRESPLSPRPTSCLASTLFGLFLRLQRGWLHPSPCQSVFTPAAQPA